MPADRSVGGGQLSRRDGLRGAAALVAAFALGGCDIRLDDDAPDLPLLPRKSVPDEAALVEAARRTAALAQIAGRVPQPSETVTRLAAVHRTQADVLRARLTSQGVPASLVDGSGPGSTGSATSGSATSGPTAAVSAPPPSSPQEVAAAQIALVGVLLPSLPTATAANRPVLTSVTSAAAAGAGSLGATVPWPAGGPLPAAAAVVLLEQTRAAAYGFQVVAARTGAALRTAALATRAELDRRAADLLVLAGTAAPPAPLGYALPFPVGNDDDSRRLAASVLTTLVAGGLVPLAGLPTGSTALTVLVRLITDAQRLAASWGVAPVPFPGQSYP